MRTRNPWVAGLPVALTAGLSAVLTACAPQPLNPFGRPYDETNTLKPFVVSGCKGAHDQAPMLKSGSRPHYPAGRVLADAMADVLVEFEVTADGKARLLTRAEGPDKAFINHIGAAMTDWVLEPARFKGQPVAVQCQLQQGFRIIGPWAPV